ncbi:bacteriocin immunity protein [Rosenbergiella nectarea]|uniref:bacteriocin immunity protein n=1 Tax=Rosenbergiella nectarea TaxID=988801 RepID=UPI001BD92DE7|nr:bacteriocin immunity protein [Rosenbergiella nectarea]MBT0729898.1 bacteriocin immunity protein [Rosenbergiella nectarea subsp. apis]
MKKISDYTEREFLDLVRKLFDVSNTTEAEDIQNILEFKRLTEHPDGSDLIYYPREDREDSPEGVVREVKEWRIKNGKSGFNS